MGESSSLFQFKIINAKFKIQNHVETHGRASQNYGRASHYRRASSAGL